MWHRHYWDKNGVYSSESTSMPRQWLMNPQDTEHFVAIGDYLDDVVWWFHVESEPCRYAHYRVILFRWLP